MTEKNSEKFFKIFHKLSSILSLAKYYLSTVKAVEENFFYIKNLRLVSWVIFIAHLDY